MIRERESVIRIPGIDQPLSLILPPGLQRLREKALAAHQQGWEWWQPLPELAISDAAAWGKHTDDEDWLLWRARRFAERLEHMHLELEDGELVAGKPHLGRKPLAEEQARAAEAAKALEQIPPFPGGDCGHFHPNYEKLFRQGVGGLLEEITTRRAACDISDEQRTFYDACRIAMEGFQAFIVRVGRQCDVAGQQAPDAAPNWHRLAEICRRVAVQTPQSFQEACQLMFLTYVAAWFAEDHVMTCYGRMDRTLRPFYQADVAAGSLTPQQALEILCCLYIQINRTCPYSLADGVIVGGRDGRGNDVTNPLSYLCLAARLATRLCYPTLAIAWHEGTPQEFMDFAMEMLAAGINDPAFYNDELIAAGLQDHGASAEDSHNYMNSTCVEIKTVGNSNIWVATRYHNCCAALLEAMRREAEGQTPPAGDFNRLQDRAREILAEEVRQTAEHLDDVWRRRQEIGGGFPFASCLIDDCLDRGLDHDRGGCRYQWAENSFVGLANLTDSLVAIRELVYERGEMTLADLYQICRENFQGREALRQRILTRLPKYGRDDDRADAIAVNWADFLCRTTEACTVGGHRFVPGFFCHVNHAVLGSQTGATPDGRLAGTAFADGAGAAQGRESRGPTASVLSTTKWSHRKALGGLVLNVRFAEPLLDSHADRQAIQALIETYLRRGGFEIQVNVVSGQTLCQAQERPEDHRDLIVRVAGYSDYFTTLRKDIQDEIIARTEFCEA